VSLITSTTWGFACGPSRAKYCNASMRTVSGLSGASSFATSATRRPAASPRGRARPARRLPRTNPRARRRCLSRRTRRVRRVDLRERWFVRARRNSRAQRLCSGGRIGFS
jgi:hypothetical protein